MFNKNDPLISAVSGVMKENEFRRDVEKKLCEELGIYSRKVLPREHQANYDALLEQRLTEALHPNQQKLDVHEPEKDKLTKHDFKMLRAGKKSKEMSEAELAAPETGPRKTSGSNQPIAEEQLDEVSKKTLGSYIKKASHDVATRSAQVRGHAMKSKEAVDKNDIRTARQEDERSNKAFKKSWSRRQGIAKAADKLTKEEVQDSSNPLPPAGAKERIQNKLGTQPKSTFTGDSGMAKSKEDRDEMNKKMEKLDEAAKSKAQQRLMGMALAMRRGESDRGSSKVAKIATDMPEKELKKFAKTKRKGLPEKVKKIDENLSIDDVMEEIARNLFSKMNALHEANDEAGLQVFLESLTEEQISIMNELAGAGFVEPAAAAVSDVASRGLNWLSRQTKKFSNYVNPNKPAATASTTTAPATAAPAAALPRSGTGTGTSPDRASMASAAPAAASPRPGTGTSPRPGTAVPTASAAASASPVRPAPTLNIKQPDKPFKQSDMAPTVANASRLSPGERPGPTQTAKPLPSMAVSGPNLTATTFRGNTPSVSAKDALGDTGNKTMGSYAGVKATGFASDKPAAAAAPKPAARPVAAADRPAPGAVEAGAQKTPTPAASTSKQAYQDYSNKGDDASSADFFRAANMQKKSSAMNESLVDTIRKVIKG